MKILMFNHHPDCLYYMWKAFTELGHDVWMADEDTTLGIFGRTSTFRGNFQIVNQMFRPADVHPDFSQLQFIEPGSDLSNFDLFMGIDPKMLLFLPPKKAWWDCRLQGYLDIRPPQHGFCIGTTNLPDAPQALHSCPNYVPPQPAFKEPRYIVQMITQPDKSPLTPELTALRDLGMPVRIHGGPDCRDGFKRENKIFPSTALLCHEKQTGVSCYAVLKALDMGIPVYMSRMTKGMIGFGDLPDELFLFIEDMDIKTAYEHSLTMDRAAISQRYREIYSLQRLLKRVGELLELLEQD